MAFATISSHIEGLNHGDSVVLPTPTTAYDLAHSGAMLSRPWLVCYTAWGRARVMMPHATTTII
jgi:hypothetical protein